MFQSFEVTSQPALGAARLADLRAVLAGAGLDGFIVPRADVHQGEYVAPCDARLRWLTGFSGSAGFCLVLPDVAGVFVDGRYRTQVKGEVDPQVFTPIDWPEVGAGEWLAKALPKGGRVGFDPWLHTAREAGELEERLAGTGITLVAGPNYVDQVWKGRPQPPAAPIAIQPLDYAGEPHEDKLARIAAAVRLGGAQAAVLTLPDSLSWLLNIRGADIVRNPVVQSFGILHGDGCLDFYVADAKVTPQVRAHFGPRVRLCQPADFAPALAALRGPVRVDRLSAPLEVSRIVSGAGAQVLWGADPCLLPKACKNAAEIAGAEAAHLRDGAAVVEFLCWLAANGKGGGVSEVAAVTALEGFRAASNALKEISFDTICGSGPNGAIMHYRVSHASDRSLQSGEIVVIDSGGQYLDGTTDITRTVAIGEPSREARDCFTRVLQGMIAMSRLRFPKGLSGQHIDAVARVPLWLAHQDYNHGTGHGVGSYLSVHEGPAGLSRRSDQPLEPGMILSNEPGYYREGAFGIRIENLILVEQAPCPTGGDSERQMLTFRTLTFAPIDRALIATGLMTKAEIDWLNAYHAEVLEKIGPRVSPAAHEWLRAACAAL